jgi:YidC/Oxa1 family membrane protein insertase
MSNFFYTALTQPLLNALIWLHNLLPGNDIGWAIIVLTVLVRFLLYPSFQKQIRSQRQMQKIQPQMEEIRKKHKDDKDAQARATMEFYKENKINPLSACLPALIQLPILFALYRVFLTSLGGDEVVSQLYAFVADPGVINTNFLGIVDLAQRSIILGLLAGAFQFVQSKMLMPKVSPGSKDISSAMTKQMTYLLPVVTVFISASLPAGLALYWIVTTLFAIAQQFYIIKRVDRQEKQAV